MSARKLSGHSSGFGSLGRGMRLVMTPITTWAGDTLAKGSSRDMSSYKSIPYLPRQRIRSEEGECRASV